MNVNLDQIREAKDLLSELDLHMFNCALLPDEIKAEDDVAAAYDALVRAYGRLRALEAEEVAGESTHEAYALSSDTLGGSTW